MTRSQQLSAFLRSSLGSGLPLPALAESDWERLFQLAATEEILPAIHPKLAELELLPALPPEIAESLQAVADLNRDRNRLILRQARSIVGLLNDAGIEPVALKGLAYLLSGVFPDLATRYLLDVDFLLPAEQMNTAVKVLERLGYLPNTDDTLASFRHHAPRMQMFGSVAVEFHHALTLAGSGRNLLEASEMIGQSSLVDWEGARLRLPSAEHLVTHLILHSQIHHTYRERIRPTLRAMNDLASLTRRLGDTLDWKSLEHRFQKNGHRTTLQLHLLEVHGALGMPLPFPIHLGPIARVRAIRRRLLNGYPALRFLDPIYLSFSILTRRIRLLRSACATSAGWKKAIAVLADSAFYRHLLSDIAWPAPRKPSA